MLFNVVGSGLIALDLILSEHETVPARVNVLAGGSCGNVLTILAYLGWQSYPVAQLGDCPASELLCQDMLQWGVNTNFLKIFPEGVTPIIIHRIYSDKAKHRFEFKNPQTQEWFPRFRPATKKYVADISSQLPHPTVFYFDRISPAILSMAADSRRKGAVIFFEPSSIKDPLLFEKALSVCDILKFSQDRLPNFSELYPNSQVAVEIQTLGHKGVAYRLKNHSSEWHHLSAFHVDEIVDSAGAGDWCTAGIIHTLINTSRKSTYELSQKEIEQAIMIGQSMGVVNCCFAGARGAMYNMSLIDFKALSMSLVEHRGILKSDIDYLKSVQRVKIISDEASSIGYNELICR